MAATATITRVHSGPGSSQTVQGTINLGTYASDGVAVVASTLSLGQLDFLNMMNEGGYVFNHDPDNGKVLAYYADYDAGADGALIEVANGVDLSSVEAQFMAQGVGA